VGRGGVEAVYRQLFELERKLAAHGVPPMSGDACRSSHPRDRRKRPRPHPGRGRLYSRVDQPRQPATRAAPRRHAKAKTGRRAAGAFHRHLSSLNAAVVRPDQPHAAWRGACSDAAYTLPGRGINAIPTGTPRMSGRDSRN
jgi:hypothetical protein